LSTASAPLDAGETRAQAFARDVRALPREAWVVFAGTFINRFGSFVLTFLVLILVRRGFSPAQAGIAAAAYGAGCVASALVGGHAADRFGRRRTIALSMFSGAAVMLAMWRAESLPAIIALAALAGVTAELYRPAAAALLADYTPPGRRVVAFALYRLAINAGFAMGPAVAGFLADRSLAFVFVGDAVTCALYGTLILFAIPRSADQPRTHAAPDLAAADPPDVDRSHLRRSDADRSRVRPAEAPPSAFQLMAADRALVMVLVAGTALSFVYHQATVSLALEVDARGMSTASFGLLMSLNGLFCLLLELPVAAVTARLPAWLPLAAGAALTGIGFGATALAPTLIALAATVFVWTLGEVVYAPVASAYVADLAPRPDVQGRYQAALGFTGAAGMVLAPALGPALFGWSRGGLWSLCAGLGVAAGLVFVALRGARRAAAVVA
jgi:MFS family permease